MATVPSASVSVSSRRLKKREIDRRCQQQARQKAKSRIAYLEGLVEDLKNQDASGRLEHVMKQLSNTQKEKELLSSKLDDIQKILGTEQPTTDDGPRSNPAAVASPCEAVPFNEPQANGSAHTLAGKREDIGKSADNASNEWRVSIPPALPRPLLPDSVWINLPHASDQTIRLCPQACAQTMPQTSLTCDCGFAKRLANSSKATTNLWHYANVVLEERFKWLGEIPPDEDALSEDTPIRAVIEGWDSLDKCNGMSPSWNVLRRIDETLFSICGPVERLAILLTMHILLQFHCEPTGERFNKLPPWYWARPSQSVAPSYASNYFTWPGLRERFAFSQHRYCSNIFWKLFSPNLRVLWPYEFRDCYMRDTEMGLYKVSPAFRERIGDLKSWTMGPDLFKQFPELYADIPASSTVPRSIRDGFQLRSKKPDEEVIPSAVSTSGPMAMENMFPLGGQWKNRLPEVQLALYESEVPQSPDMSGGSLPRRTREQHLSRRA